MSSLVKVPLCENTFHHFFSRLPFWPATQRVEAFFQIGFSGVGPNMHQTEYGMAAQFSFPVSFVYAQYFALRFTSPRLLYNLCSSEKKTNLRQNCSHTGRASENWRGWGKARAVKQYSSPVISDEVGRGGWTSLLKGNVGIDDGDC